MRAPRASRAFVIPALLAVISSAGCSSDAGSSPQVGGGDVAAPIEWLFVVQSDGETTYDAATEQLSIPARAVQAFTDRPHRDTRATSPQAFVNLWGSADPESFAEDPPNAVLTFWDATSGSAVPRTIVCEIVGGVDYSSSTGRLVMELRVLDPHGAVIPARMERASLFVDGLAEDCPGSPDDEVNIEFFNMMMFNEEFTVGWTQLYATGQVAVRINCPERGGASIPAASFDLRISRPDGSDSVSCYEDRTIVLDRQGLAELSSCATTRPCANCVVETCQFLVTALNTVTGAEYSVTTVGLELSESGTTVVPDLQPATSPACSSP